MDRRHFLTVVAALLAAGCTGDDTSENDDHPTPSAGAAPGLVRTDDPFRPAYHFSPATGNLADPDGLVAFDGEYHLFYQADGRWAHAVSTDRWWWRDLPVALDPDALGLALSGSAVVDRDDSCGLLGGRSGIVAAYTSTEGGEAQSIAASTDRGRTFVRFDGNPVLPNGGRVDFRDPKVLRHEQTDRWVMVVSSGDHVSLFGSDDLRTWDHLSDFGAGHGLHSAVWECPDLFPLPLDGDPARTQWVLHVSVGDSDATDGSTAQYFVGDFDGTTFTPQGPPEAVAVTDFGQDFYAAQTWYDDTSDDVVWIAWMSNWRYPYQTPTGDWHGAMSVPRVLSLETREGTPCLIQRPLDLDPIADAERRFATVEVAAGQTWTPEVHETAYAFRATLAWDDADEVGVRLRHRGPASVSTGVRPRDRVVFLDRSASGTEPLPSRDGDPVSFGRRTTTRGTTASTSTVVGLVDACSVEVFWDDGRHVGTNLVFTDPANNGMQWYADGASLRITDLTITPLRRISTPAA